MVFEQSEIRGLLVGVVRRLTQVRTLQEDLMQEALIDLWLLEKEQPRQTRSWYIQGCRLHLQNYMRKGRSVDSPKHRPTAAWHDGEDQGQAQGAEPIHDTLFALVCARDLVSEMSNYLTPVEKQILKLRLEDVSLREIAVRLGLSHTNVIKHRRHIAACARWFGFDVSTTARPGRTMVFPKARNGVSRTHPKGRLAAGPVFRPKQEGPI